MVKLVILGFLTLAACLCILVRRNKIQFVRGNVSMKKLLVLLTVVMLMLSSLTTVLAAPKPDNGLGGASKHLQDKFGLSNASDHFKMVKTESDSLGYKHVKLQQVVNGIPVYGGEYIVHFNKSGNIYSDSGKFFEKAKGFKAKGQFITKEAAINAAKKDIDFAGKTAASGSKYQDDEIKAELYLYKVDE
jgi:Zn-dependent metalloprotease